ncbi:MAG: L,D-transpeptidase family protein, partial [Chromatiales bacterium]|nr:L,D-transpeptidase family protein [Chromatiales bacterium]
MSLSVHAAQIPSHIFSRDGDVNTTVLVDKSTKAAYLVDIKDNKPRLLRSFDNLLFGENGGDKLREGDKRTPEGVYRITSFIPDENLAPIYGSGAFPIDYPNPLDKIEGRNGSGIWLHGRAYDDPNKNTTRGCVAFNNNEISELQKILGQNTPVIITKNAEFVSEPEYNKQREKLLNTLDEFINAWEVGNSKKLTSFLHPDFKSAGGKGKSAWIQHKQRLDNLYPEKNIETDNVYIFKEDGQQVVFEFKQYYCAKNIISVGEKQLYFKNDNGKLQLLTESFERLPIGNYIDDSVNEFLSGWVNAWERGDINSYIDRYAGHFVDPKGRDHNAWKDYKARIFANRPNQQIAIDNIKVTQLANNRYEVSFRQQYTSDQYTDLGTKTITLDGCPGAFKIAS